MGVVDVGVIGRGYITRLYSTVSPADLVAMADVSQDAARTAAAEFGVDAASSVEHLLDRDDIDAVVVAVPSGLHADVAVRARRRETLRRDRVGPQSAALRRPEPVLHQAISSGGLTSLNVLGL
ncbi:Gfo/Idh/MocA family oxidoreductase [Phytoactinopolyspora alkaliphila]|uniref:Gfo/Idh/MocA family oxidoreductase n=1 Tax=Phytoactinopolyspora alkaliphila TaxID=1783498 RepID=A0A6N9YSB3_9ACTN|nr:Gfo/Idh/MocA family oxidoreductase [Phytoactinopolyspora alkaliphila]NED97864.1 Gfo/Idh/MocA family oxidoreductase [Phytoactinopolyspora alkaliphila]